MKLFGFFFILLFALISFAMDEFTDEDLREIGSPLVALPRFAKEGFLANISEQIATIAHELAITEQGPAQKLAWWLAAHELIYFMSNLSKASAENKLGRTIAWSKHHNLALLSASLVTQQHYHAIEHDTLQKQIINMVRATVENNKEHFLGALQKLLERQNEKVEMVLEKISEDRSTNIERIMYLISQWCLTHYLVPAYTSCFKKLYDFFLAQLNTKPKHNFLNADGIVKLYEECLSTLTAEEMSFIMPALKHIVNHTCFSDEHRALISL